MTAVRYEIVTQNGVRVVRDPVQPGTNLVVVATGIPDLRTPAKVEWFEYNVVTNAKSQLVGTESVFSPMEAHRGKWFRAIVNDHEWTTNAIVVAA